MKCKYVYDVSRSGCVSMARRDVLILLIKSTAQNVEKTAARQLVKKFASFMEHDSPLPYSQQPATCPYLEPVRPHPCPPKPLLANPYWYCVPIYVYISQVASFLQVSPPKPCIRLSSLTSVLHVQPISFFLISTPEKYLVNSTDH